MNIREILGLILLFIFVASCSEESPIDEYPYETGIFTLRFTMNDGVNTKATADISGASEVPGHANGYSYSTEAELKVNNCFIAVLQKETMTHGVKKYMQISIQVLILRVVLLPSRV